MSSSSAPGRPDPPERVRLDALVVFVLLIVVTSALVVQRAVAALVLIVGGACFLFAISGLKMSRSMRDFNLVIGIGAIMLGVVTVVDLLISAL